MWCPMLLCTPIVNVKGILILFKEVYVLVILGLIQASLHSIGCIVKGGSANVYN